MAAESIQRKDRNVAGTGFMLLSVVSYSLVPLLIASGGGVSSPFLFVAALRLGQFGGHTAFIVLFFRDVLFNKTAMSIVMQRILTWSILFVAINNLDYGFFALATRFVDISVAAILYETWPIAVILLTALLFRGERRYRKIKPDVMLLLAIGFLGFSFVATSQTGGFGNWGDSQFTDTLIGIGLVLLAIGSAAMGAYGFRWGADLNRALPDELISDKNSDLVDICCVLTAQIIGSFVSVVLFGTVGFFIGEIITFKSLCIAIACGAFANGLGHLAWRAGNILTDNLGINAISYSTPIFSLIWLFMFWTVDIVRVDYLIIGAVAIVSANLLINFEVEVRFGFKALILALWAFGAFVYLRDDLLNLLPFETWLWPGDTYPEALALSATIFILLLSFRVARMSERTQDEDNRILELFQSLDLLVRRNVIDRAVRDHLIKLDDARTPAELQSSYNKTKLCFAEAVAAGPDARNLARLGAAETQLNIIVHSRQQGIELGELFALLIFGGSTILIGILSRPPLTGWIGFLVEILAVLFSAVIVFLIINVWDLHRERANLILKKRKDSDDYGLIFSNPRSRRFEQSMSVIIGLAITVAYAALLWQKWLP